MMDALSESAILKSPLPLLVTGLCEGALDVFRICVSGDVKDRFGKPPVILVADDKEAADVRDMMAAFGVNALLFPARDLNLHGAVASREFEQERVRVLAAVTQCPDSVDAVVTTPEAALSFTVPGKKLNESLIKVSSYERLDLDEFTLALVNSGYTGTEDGETVDGAGQFSVRGGIIDVCPPFMISDGKISAPETGDVSQHGEASDFRVPKGIRIELFGDEIDRIGTFDIGTQRMDKDGNIDSVIIPPACEVILSNESRDRVAASIKKLIKKAERERLIASGDLEIPVKKISKKKKKKSAPDEDAESDEEPLESEEMSAPKDLVARLNEELVLVEMGFDVPFSDRFLPVIYPERECLLDYLGGFGGSEYIAVVSSANAISQRLEGIRWQNEKTAESLIIEGIVEPSYSTLARHDSDIERYLMSRAYILIETFTGSKSGMKLGGMFDFNTRHVIEYAGNVQLLRDDLGGYIKGGYRVVLLTDAEPAANEVADLLNSEGASAFVFGDDANVRIEPSSVGVTWGAFVPFEMTSERFAVLSMRVSSKVSARTLSKVKIKGKSKRGKGTAAESILSYADLKEGDFVVHAAYGVGLFTGIENLCVDGVYRDYISLKYAGKDKLFLPVDQLEHVSKYIGAGSAEGAVKLSRMGGTDWQKAKNKAKGAAKEMARELISLYSKRTRVKGIAFEPDDDMSREFAQNFPYDETDDQLESISDVAKDMEKPYPMDRLLCGDVGYGKTEVALRAAFKAVMSGKQVAILVPTTILALQHLQTSLARFAGFPVKIDMLSRFRTPKQQERTLRALKRGEVDIIVGTHRLISEDVQFFDLGLVIVDEEQRFGVAHKEKLKSRWNDVDVLTLTATPIPRTLNMAMSGIRDMSVLTEAPVDRQPVQTYVLEHDDAVLAEAIQRELRRGGQVFYMHNRVESIYTVAARIRKMIPDARIEVAHGKMEREQLEDIWRSLVEGECDILVSTTIIETGIDVPRANTLIIDNADRLGLSQLHQLRGRVGRSERRAYAYFTYPRGKALSEIAEKRLEAIREYAKFGAGFKIALRDLELRGAGSLLGSQQHGHLEAIGYDLYIRLLEEAVFEEQMESGIKTEADRPKQAPECAVEIKSDAYLPKSYIKSAPQRMELYKRIARIMTEDDQMDILDEMCDRFGEPPMSARNLLTVSLIRGLARSLSVVRVEQHDAKELWFVPLESRAAEMIPMWMQLSDEYKNSVRMVMASPMHVSFKIPQAQPGSGQKKPLDMALEVLKKLNKYRGD